MNKEILREMIKCADREVKKRKEVYPRLVANGKMTQKKADNEIKLMTLIKVSLQKIDAGTAEAQVQKALFDTQPYEKHYSINDYENGNYPKSRR